ncbi:hypothetical protein PGTUg99_005616 [Puccinia graminis f. sp. tritici]|uniref:Uncharacterized protein n=1 Tax=Puccinia graminis f. sp. tritici TaxID=56615 RepID=A0A5B0SCZ6_PUCGR|nr:hypothetical protein PGTUg99_005616 [Puccinia graminis f. sp. tritici]
MVSQSSVSFSTERFVEFGKDWSIELELQGRPGRQLESNAWPAGYIRSLLESSDNRFSV